MRPIRALTRLMGTRGFWIGAVATLVAGLAEAALLEWSDRKNR